MKRFLIAVLMFLPFPVLADTVESGHAKITSVSNWYTVADDLSYEHEVDAEIKTLTEQGARQEGKFPINYNRALSSVEILHAETIKANGQRLPVPESAITRQSGSIGQLTFKDLEIISIAFPDLTAGDSVHVRYRSRNKPLFPGYFFFSKLVLENFVVDKEDIRLEVPEQLALQIDKIGFAVDRDEVQQGRRFVQWSHRNPVAKKQENGQVDAILSQPHLMVTSLPSWNALAKAYMDRHVPQMEATEEISRLAKELTEGAASEREKARRIYDWVRKNIRYVAIYAGLEPWVPHKAREVLANRFGDCKDHAVLLDALLHAVGIESVPVMIISDLLNYQLPKVALPVFNHAISYLPGLDLYLDSTSVHTEFGRLPDADRGKMVLRGGLSETVDVTPVSKASERQLSRKTKIQVDDKGGARVETTVRMTGDFRDWYEQFRQGISAGKENVWAQNRLTSQNKRGTARLEFLPEENGWSGFRIRQTIENYLPEGEIGLLGFLHAEAGPMSTGTVTSVFEARVRNSSFACRAADIEDLVEITLPENIKFLRLPSSRAIDGDGVSLRVDYSRRDSSYEMNRRLVWNPGNSNSCSKHEWLAWLNPMRKIHTAVKSASLAFERDEAHQ